MVAFVALSVVQAQCARHDQKEGIMGFGNKSINDWVEAITAWGERKGWHKPVLAKKKGVIARGHEKPPKGVNVSEVLAKLMLVNTELAEAAEEAREGRYETWFAKPAPKNALQQIQQDGLRKPEGFAIELADAQIRIMHIAGLLGLDLERAVQEKMAYNKTRSRRHGGKKA